MANDFDALSLKTLLVCTSVFFLSMALLLKPSIVPATGELATSVVRQVRAALLPLWSPHFLFLLINAIIIYIAASSRFRCVARDPTDNRFHRELSDEEAADEKTVELTALDQSASPDEGSKDIRLDPEDPVDKREASTGSRPDWARERMDRTEDSLETEKPMVEVRLRSLKGAKASSRSQGSKDAGAVGPTSDDTLESVWKRITKSCSVPMAQSHLKKSSGHLESNMGNVQIRSSPSPSLMSLAAPKKFLPREPSLSHDELNQQVEAFIKKVNQQMRLQRDCSPDHH